MDRIDCLSAFVHVLESGSFSGAARRLGTTQPTISKRIARLEAEFGTSLFLRTTRRLSPTREAERIYEHARGILETFDLATAQARDVSPQPTGILAMSVPSSVGRHLLMPTILEFMRRYPGVTLDLRLSERPFNLIEEGVELAIRIGKLSDATLRARLLGSVRRFAVASPFYLQDRPVIRDPADLSDHQCIGYAPFGDVAQWTFEGEIGRYVVDVDCAAKLDDVDAIQTMAVEGLGIAILPIWLVAPMIDAGKLEIVLPDFTIPSLPLNAVYFEPRKLSLRARRFLDLLIENRSVFDYPMRPAQPHY